MRFVLCAVLVAACMSPTASALSNHAHHNHGTIAPSGDNSESFRLDNGMECKACVFTIGKMEDFLTQNSTIAKVDSSVKKMCKQYLPSQAEECEAFLGMGVKYAIHYIENDLSPADLCKDAGMCGSSSDSMVASGIECTACELAMKEANKKLSDTKIQAKIISDLEKKCEKSFGKDIGGKCKAFIAEKGPQFLKELAAKVSPALCSKSGMC